MHARAHAPSSKQACMSQTHARSPSPPSHIQSHTSYTLSDTHNHTHSHTHTPSLPPILFPKSQPPCCPRQWQLKSLPATPPLSPPPSDMPVQHLVSDLQLLRAAAQPILPAAPPPLQSPVEISGPGVHQRCVGHQQSTAWPTCTGGTPPPQPPLISCSVPAPWMRETTACNSQGGTLQWDGWRQPFRDVSNVGLLSA
jgi:hypothetical protein